jgi:hypothetical protein
LINREIGCGSFCVDLLEDPFLFCSRELAQATWGIHTKIYKNLIDGEFSHEHVSCVVIGNTFKELKLRASVLTMYILYTLKDMIGYRGV